MFDYMIPVTHACTLVTLSYIALKIKTRVEAYELAAVPALTGIAAIVMMLLPLPAGFPMLDLRFVPIVMAGLRFGWAAALLSTVLPGAFSFFHDGVNLPFGLVQNLLLPAIISPLFHRREYLSGYMRIRLQDGWKITALLCVTRVATGYFWLDRPVADWPALHLTMLLVTAAALTVLIAMFNDESRNWLVQRQLEMQANQDGLTRLPNLRSFMHIAKNTLKKRPVSIFMIDIDNFKNFNDRLGHLQGDQLLRDVSRTLCASIGEQDYIARYGGEEFIMVCHSYDMAEVAAKAVTLCEAVARQTYAGQEVQQGGRISVSIGIAIAQRGGEDLHKLIGEADEALYESKKTGKNKFTVYRLNVLSPSAGA